MARPKKSLLQRCLERSFRARHHWPLLASEPDLPCRSLAELQQRAREAETEDEAKEIGRVLEPTLATLSPEEWRLLLQAQSPAAADDSGQQEPPPATSSRRERTEAFLAAVEAALAELSTRFHTELTAREEIEAELIRRAAERLAEIGQRLAEEGLTASGSQRQLRPHPLIAFEAGLRHEITQNLRQLEFRVDNRAMLERMKALSRKRRSPERARDPAAAPAGQRPGRKPAAPSWPS